MELTFIIYFLFAESKGRPKAAEHGISLIPAQHNTHIYRTEYCGLERPEDYPKLYD